MMVVGIAPYERLCNILEPEGYDGHFVGHYHDNADELSMSDKLLHPG
jgi:hypothetical protein